MRLNKKTRDLLSIALVLAVGVTVYKYFERKSSAVVV
jgi:hypothetical protein